jgi:hypothetical protein
MTVSRLVIGAVFAAAFSACSGMTIQTDYDPVAAPNLSRYQSYRWLPQPQCADTRVYNPITQGRIVRAVEAELGERGYTKDSQSPEFLVGWHATIEGRMDVQSMNTYYGYGWGRWRAGGGVIVQDNYVREYNEGMLILDIVDANSNELVWRGSAQAEITRSTDPAKRQEQINKAVKKILERFPPQA